jgi:hypothetical protein
MNILAIDPGTTESAAVVWSVAGQNLLECTKVSNRHLLMNMVYYLNVNSVDVVVIEKVESYGMPVGREIFETVLWSGIFNQAARSAGHSPIYHVPRRAVKLELCGTSKAKDANIRQAIIDLYGPVPKKSQDNAHYGLFKPSKDTWQAWALAVAFASISRTEKERVREWRFPEREQKGE